MEGSISRRDLLLGGAGAIAVATLETPAAMAADEHASHGAMAHQALVAAARSCVGAGDDCLAHCLAMFAAGDTSLGTCAKRVAEMLPACAAVARLATLDAKRLGQFLGPCIDVCADCEAECRKHAEKHAVCKACADACARFIAEAKKSVAA